MSFFNELAHWDAVETAERIRRREVSRSEVLEAAIARAEEAAPLGAVVTPSFEHARKVVAKRRGPLAGVPTFIKDLSQMQGVQTRWGSRGAGRFHSRKTDTSVRRIQAAGFVSLGKSATPELGMTATTEPLGMLPCRNPWDPRLSPGGSSGGAGALVAAGVVPLAHASDGGGSIRIPASCCGLVGLKVTRGRMDVAGSTLLPLNVGVDGCVSRTVRDTVAFWESVERFRLPWRPPPIGRPAPEPPRALKIGLFVNSAHGTPVHPDNQKAARDAGRLCEQLGHHVEEIGCPASGSFTDDFLLYWGFMGWVQKLTARAVLHRDFDASQLEPWTRHIAKHASSAPFDTTRAMRRLRRFHHDYTEIMSHWDVLLSPTLASPPPEIGFLATDLPFETKLERVREYAAFTPAQNVAGAPAISLPLTRSSEGLPLGVQFAAAVGQDRLLLELALQVEAAAPWQLMAPPAAWQPLAERD